MAASAFALVAGCVTDAFGAEADSPDEAEGADGLGEVGSDRKEEEEEEKEGGREGGGVDEEMRTDEVMEEPDNGVEEEAEKGIEEEPEGMTEEEPGETEDIIEVLVNRVDDDRTGEDTGLDVLEEAVVNDRIREVDEGVEDGDMGAEDGVTGVEDGVTV